MIYVGSTGLKALKKYKAYGSTQYVANEKINTWFKMFWQ